MKVAIISDLHANKLALEEVLKDIEQFNPDKIFCLGDLILAGYNPNWVCEKVLELKEKYQENFIAIQGNTDKMVAFCNDRKNKRSFSLHGLFTRRRCKNYQ